MDARENGFDRRLARVAALIEERLDNGAVPQLAELAAAAALSPFHFHRVYRLATGETVTESVRRLQLEIGIRAMEEEGANVTVAAQRAGYSSSQSFARAVKSQTGATATELTLSDGGAATALSDARNGPRALDLVSLAPLRVVARAYQGPYEALNEGYRALFGDVMQAVPPEAVAGVYGIPIDDPRDVAPEAHRFDCCLALTSDAPVPGTRQLDLTGGTYALCRHEGPYATLPEAVDALYRDIIAAGASFADEPTYVHYVDQPRSDDGADAPDHISVICVPLAA